MAPAALAALLLLAPAAAAAAAGNASSASAVERGLVQDAQPAAWAKECLAYFQLTDSLPNQASPAHDPRRILDTNDLTAVSWRRASSRKATSRD